VTEWSVVPAYWYTSENSKTLNSDLNYLLLHFQQFRFRVLDSDKGRATLRAEDWKSEHIKTRALSVTALPMFRTLFADKAGGFVLPVINRCALRQCINGEVF